jgi:DNA-directed RNA polymerase subunit RPC12/RpoP
MGIAVFVVLTLLSAAAIAYPLLNRQATSRSAGQVARAITDSDIENAMRQMRRSRLSPATAGRFRCPACGHGHQPGDRFCVRCGGTLPQTGSPESGSSGLTCPNCDAALREHDQFCAKCGQRIEPATGLEAADPGEAA